MIERGRRVDHQVGLKRHHLAAERLEPLHGAVGRDGEIEHLEPPRRREPLPGRVVLQPLFELIDVGVLVAARPSPCPSTSRGRRCETFPAGFSIVDRVVVHAEGIGDERLAEQGPLDQRLELELEEVVVEVVDDVGFLEADPARRFADQPQRRIAARSLRVRRIAADQALVVAGRVALALGAVQLGRARAVDHVADAVPAGRPGKKGHDQQQKRLNDADSGRADRARFR